MEFVRLTAGVDSTTDKSTPANQRPMTVMNYSLVQLQDLCTNITQTISLDEGESWHFIDAPWFQKLKKFAESKRKGCAEPSKLDNSSLLDDESSSELIGEFKPVKNTLLDEADYVLVPHNEWKILHSLGLADVAQDIHRYTVTIGNQTMVEVQPLDLRICQYNGSAEKRCNKRLLMSRKATCGEWCGLQRFLWAADELADFLRSIAGSKQYRVWRRPHGERMELLNVFDKKMQATQLKDIDFCDKEMLVLEMRKPSHEWLLDSQSERHLLFPDTEPVFAPVSETSTEIMNDNKELYAVSRYNLRSSTKRARDDEIVPKDGKPEHISREPESAGRCGLINLGNTCFMDSTLQCLLHLPDLRDYFLNNLHFYEFNTNNPLGHGGRIAKAFGEVMQNAWKKDVNTFSPRKFKHALGQAYPQFYGFWEQDSQEFMTYLLDGVHEDVNRIQTKPYVEYGDADDRSDEDLARESWYNFRLRNQSVIVDLFFGMIKSTVTCPDCNRVSVTFDPVNQLSCPLPEPRERSFTFSYVGAPDLRPVKRSLSVNRDHSVDDFLQLVSERVNVPKTQLVLAELQPSSNYVRAIFRNDQKLAEMPDTHSRYFVYAVPLPSSNGGEHKSVLRAFLDKAAQQNLFHGSTSINSDNSNDDWRYAVVYVRCAPRNDAETKPKTASRQRTASNVALNGDAAGLKPESAEATDSLPGGSGSRIEGRASIHKKLNPSSKHSSMHDLSSTNSLKDEFAKNSTIGVPSISNDSDGWTTSPLIIRIPTHGIRSSELYRFVQSCMPFSSSLVNNEFAFDLSRLETTEKFANEVWKPIPRPPRGRSASGETSPYTLRSSKLLSNANDPIITFNTNSNVEENESGHTNLVYLCATFPINYADKINDSRGVESEPHVDEDSSCSSTVSSQACTSVDLYDCIRVYLQPERLSEREMWFCAACRQDKQAEKKLDIWDLPAYLIIHLKRFSFSRWRREKLRQHVRIPEELDMSQYVMNPAHVKPVMYDFVAVSNHMGDLAEGHYWAHARDRDGHWAKMNDHIVRSSSYADAAGREGDESAYLVFFKLRGFQYDLEQLPAKIFRPKSDIDADAKSTVNWPTNIGQLNVSSAKLRNGNQAATDVDRSLITNNEQHFDQKSASTELNNVEAMDVDNDA